MYKKIINPKTGRKVSIYGKIGKKILNNYIKFIGGAAANSEVVNDSGWPADVPEERTLPPSIHTEERIQEEITSIRASGVQGSDKQLRFIAINNLKNIISEGQIQQEMLSLQELGDWDNLDYLREIAIYNLNLTPPDKNITPPTRVPLTRNVFSRKDFKDARYFTEYAQSYAIFPGDIAYPEISHVHSIDPIDIEEMEDIEAFERLEEEENEE